jgi:hypothetical protein
MKERFKPRTFESFDPVTRASPAAIHNNPTIQTVLKIEVRSNRITGASSKNNLLERQELEIESEAGGIHTGAHESEHASTPSNRVNKKF